MGRDPRREPVHEADSARIRAAYRARDLKKETRRAPQASNRGNQAIVNERRRGVEALFRKAGWLPLAGRKVLEVGCGRGDVLASLLPLGASATDLFGVDLLPDRIEEGQKTYPDFHLSCANAERLDFDHASFDIIVASTIFSSIPSAGMATNVAAEMDRLLKRGGGVLWYDFRYKSPSSPHTRPMTRRSIRRLFPDYELDLRTITVLPPLARSFGRGTPFLYPALSAAPFLRSHYLGLLMKRTAMGEGRRAATGPS